MISDPDIYKEKLKICVLAKTGVIAQTVWLWAKRLGIKSPWRNWNFLYATMYGTSLRLNKLPV
jgi:hypothetical protein